MFQMHKYSANSTERLLNREAYMVMINVWG